MKQINLFGELQEFNDKKESNSPYISFKKRNNYHKAINKYACCKTCKYCLKKWGNTSNYYKCELIGVSSSEATDIRVRNVCNLWDKGE